MKIAVYTVLFGDYDVWREPEYIDSDYDYFVFTNENITPKVYKNLYAGVGDNGVLQARKVKIYNGYSLLCDMGYDLIIYHDANIIPMANLSNLINDMRTDLMTMKHPGRDCIYDEYEVCAESMRDDIDTMYKQVQRYADEGYPANNGLIASGVIFRRNTKKVKELCKAWLNEVSNGSIRDQLSFNYVATKLKFRFDLLPWGIIGTYFNYYNHKNK